MIQLFRAMWQTAAETKTERIFLRRLGYGSEHAKVSSTLPNFQPTQGVEGGRAILLGGTTGWARVGWVGFWIQFWTHWNWGTCESSKGTERGNRQIFSELSIRAEFSTRDVSSHLVWLLAPYIINMWALREARWVDEMGKSAMRWPRTSLEVLQQWVTLKTRTSLQRRRKSRRRGEAGCRMGKGGWGHWGGILPTSFISFLISGGDEWYPLHKVASGSKWNMTYAKG